MKLKAPFPWFGGKSRIATDVWKHFGDVSNYVEPFAGSMAVLLGRPGHPGLETVNDIDCYLANFWRAVANAPNEVARYADAPVNEADLTARHRWLIDRGKGGFRNQMKTYPDFFDVKIAGWWVWGISAWIGSGWCIRFAKQLPHLKGTGKGVHRITLHTGTQDVQTYFRLLQLRLKRVRVACGDWSRVLGPSVTTKNGVTGVFLDPPYPNDSNGIYSEEEKGVAEAAKDWAVANGDDPLFRIALCGYANDYDMPPDWHEVPWKAVGGYGLQGNGKPRQNAGKERVWYSPHCLFKKPGLIY